MRILPYFGIVTSSFILSSKSIRSVALLKDVLSSVPLISRPLPSRLPLISPPLPSRLPWRCGLERSSQSPFKVKDLIYTFMIFINRSFMKWIMSMRNSGRNFGNRFPTLGKRFLSFGVPIFPGTLHLTLQVIGVKGRLLSPLSNKKLSFRREKSCLYVTH